MVPAALASAAITSWLGLSTVFGAFLLGVVTPAETRAAVGGVISRGLGDISRVAFLPIFFVTAGLQVNLAHIGAAGLGDLLLIITVAVTGKFMGTLLTAKWAGASGREAAGLASLMNARGLTELVVLTIGLQSGVLDRQVYSLMVAMAVITTVMAGPLLRVLYPARRVQLEAHTAAPSRLAAGSHPAI
jgi:Kef-type K+ transport system membrane component KefB